MLEVFIFEKKYFTMSFLNDRIQHFSYGKRGSRNKPPKPIEKVHLESPGSKKHLSGIATLLVGSVMHDVFVVNCS